MKEPRKTVDWDLVAADYRAGVKTTRQIGAEYGISHTMVSKRAKADGWTRDLAAKIQAKAEDKVSRAVVAREVSTASFATEQQVVEANAELQKQIRLEHRTDIRRTRTLFQTLMEELEVASDNEGRGLIERLVELASPPTKDESGLAHEARMARVGRQVSKLLDGPSRIDSAKKLTEMLERVIRLEREAFGITNDEGKGEGSFEELLRRVQLSEGSA